MDREVYDTVDGIATMLSTHRDFDALVGARREAVDRYESLETFYVLGRFCFDDGGNVYPLSRETFNDVFRTNASAVMDDAAFFAYMRACGIEGGTLYGSANALPPPGMHCDKCGNGWAFPDIDDSCAENDPAFELDFAAHVGKTLAQLETELNAKRDGAYLVETQVRNDRWKTSKGRGSAREGWRDEDTVVHPITKEHVIQQGDEGTVCVARYRHVSCQALAHKEQRQAELEGTILGFKDAFTLAGYGNVVVESAPLPPHIVEMIRDGEELDEDEIEQAKTELPYLKVSSDLGTLFLFVASMPTIDLVASGLTVRDLSAEQADAMDAAVAAGQDIGIYDKVAGFPATIEGMCELRRVLETKKAQKQP